MTLLFSSQGAQPFSHPNTETANFHPHRGSSKSGLVFSFYLTWYFFIWFPVWGGGEGGSWGVQGESHKPSHYVGLCGWHLHLSVSMDGFFFSVFQVSEESAFPSPGHFYHFRVQTRKSSLCACRKIIGKRSWGIPHDKLEKTQECRMLL